MNTWRYRRQALFLWMCRALTLLALIILGSLILHIAKEGVSTLSLDFLHRFPSRFPHKAGLKSALYGTLWIMCLTALIAVPFGIATAIYLEEYSTKNRFSRWIQINITNLAGIPSIVYGLLGLTVFVRYLNMGQSLWAGALTLSLLVLPIIVIASQEAIRAVPNPIREAGYALGAHPWQVILCQVVPAALPGIMTGVILALSRAIGESAPLIMIGALSYVAFVPEGPGDAFTVLPVQIFNWASRPQVSFHAIAASGIIVLLCVLFTMNLIAVLIRHKFQRYK